MLLSIIIPVYNTKEYLSRCLDSVLAQQVSDMEVICVDDGSTDGSGDLLDQYASADSRIQVIHRENGGLVQARKTGIQLAQGKYVGYVDSDDYIEPEMYQVLCGIAEQYETDMVSSGYILEKGTQIEFYDGFSEGLYRGRAMNTLREQALFNEKEKAIGLRPSLCDKLFRASLLKKVQLSIPDEITNCEDRLCTLACILEAESVYILKKAFYHYVYFRNSMSHQEDLYYLDKMGNVYRALRSMYGHPNFSDKLRVQCELYIIKMLHDGMNEYMGFLVSDLIWISPGWICQFPEKSKILLYGAGRLGKAYYRLIVSDRTKRLRLSGWIDRNYLNLTDCPQRIDSPELLRSADFDYILLALADEQPAGEVRRQLINEFGVKEEKIIWLKPQEIFWEYAEAAGLLKE